ncbi:MAG: hypothetical protein H6898_09390 [Rhodobacter sp.]|nr:hypothetical protein [Paracoccaceae bacterium]MCC0076783.1 hypothetical protein [Rhodobacter sp.]
MTGFELLVWVGAFVTLTGVAGLVVTGFYAWKLRQTEMDDATMRQALQRGVARNTASLFVSVLGLMLVIMGLALR